MSDWLGEIVEKVSEFANMVFDITKIRPLYRHVNKLISEAGKPNVVSDQAAEQLLGVWLGHKTYAAGSYLYVGPKERQGRIVTSELPKPEGCVRIVIVSDTHECHDLLDIPNGDVLLHTGDFLMMNPWFSRNRSIEKLIEFNDWLGSLPHKEKFVIGGNHDKICEELGKEKVASILSHCRYVENEAVRMESGLLLYGTPASKRNSQVSPNDTFQYNPEVLEEIVGSIPRSVDIFMCHGPPDALPPILDYVMTHQPPLCVFGHVHERNGVEFGALGDTLSLNGASLGEGFNPNRTPVVHDFCIVPSTGEDTHCKRSAKL